MHLACNKLIFLFNPELFHSGLNVLLIHSIWIYQIIIAFLLILTSYFAFNCFSIRRKIKFIRNIRKTEGPFSPGNILHTLIDNIPDRLYIKDEKSRFVLANKKLVLAAGRKSEKELIGKTDHDFFPKESANEYRKDEINILTSGKPLLNREEKSKDKNGKTVWILTSKMPLFDNEGNAAGIVGIGRDITAQKKAELIISQKQLELQEVNVLLEERQEEILQQQEELKNQTEIVIEEKKQLRTLIDNIPDFIYIKDTDSRFIVANKHLAEIIGAKSTDELIGKTDFDFYSKELAEKFYKDEQEIIQSGKEIIDKEEIGLNKEGEERVISTTKVPMFDNKGVIIGIVGIGRDMTDQKNTENQIRRNSEILQETNVLLEEKSEEIQQQKEELQAQADYLSNVNNELEKLSLVASKTENVVVIMDPDTNFTWVNEGFEKKYGMGLQEFKDKHGDNLKKSSSYKNINDILDKVIHKKESASYTSGLKNTEGGYSWFQTTISPVVNKEGEVISIIAIDSDITKIKEAEEKINKQKTEIEKQRDELKKLNATKDKFFSIIAHDLKNPFHSIMGFSDLLTRSYDEIEEEKKKEFLSLIKESSASAYALLENLLQWARTQTNRIKFNPAKFDLSALIEDNKQMIGVHAQNKNLKIVTPEKDNLEVFADYNMVNTIIRNILSNAVKFTPEGGKITVNTEKTDSRMFINIEDTGVGIDNKDMSKLFKLDEFHTTTGTSGETGTGLGLIVCKEFVKKHKGDLTVEGEKGKGTTFTFSLPLHELDNN